MWIKALPSGSGVSTTLSPREIVTRHKMFFAKHCRVKFGAYVEVHEDPDTSNTLHNHTTECIALGPTGNLQGSIACFDLGTRRVLKRRTITPLPMPDHVIKKVLNSGARNPNNFVPLKSP